MLENFAASQNTFRRNVRTLSVLPAHDAGCYRPSTTDWRLTITSIASCRQLPVYCTRSASLRSHNMALQYRHCMKSFVAKMTAVRPPGLDPVPLQIVPGLTRFLLGVNASGFVVFIYWRLSHSLFNESDDFFSSVLTNGQQTLQQFLTVRQSTVQSPS